MDTALSLRPGMRSAVTQSIIGAAIVSYPNIICFVPAYLSMCTPECRMIHICYFTLRFIIFASVIFFAIERPASASVMLTARRSLLMSGAGYAVLLPMSLAASHYICADARGSILIFQFIAAALLSACLSMARRLSAANEGQSHTKSTGTAKTESLLVSHADKICPIHVDEIAYIYSSNKRTSVVTADGHSHVCTRSLDSIMRTLDESVFFRANKQFILSHRAISELTVWFDSRLLVRLKGIETPEPVYISKNKAAMFKKWMAGEVN